MFQRVVLENWHEAIPYICFALIAGVFLVIVIRAVSMKKSDVDRIASLPLQGDDTLKESRERELDADDSDDNDDRGPSQREPRTSAHSDDKNS